MQALAWVCWRRCAACTACSRYCKARQSPSVPQFRKTLHTRASLQRGADSPQRPCLSSSRHDLRPEISARASLTSRPGYTGPQRQPSRQGAPRARTCSRVAVPCCQSGWGDAPVLGWQQLPMRRQKNPHGRGQGSGDGTVGTRWVAGGRGPTWPLGGGRGWGAWSSWWTSTDVMAHGGSLLADWIVLAPPDFGPASDQLISASYAIPQKGARVCSSHFFRRAGRCGRHPGHQEGTCTATPRAQMTRKWLREVMAGEELLWICGLWDRCSGYWWNSEPV
jgi:hypothetical protein